MASLAGVVAVAGCAALAGCQSNELPSPAVVDKLRLLDLATDTPEVAPGTDVRVQAVWYDGSPHAPRDIHFRWRLCPVGADQEPRACLSPADGVDLGAGVGDDSVTVPAADIALPAGATTAAWFVFLAMCPGSDPAFDPSMGQWSCPSEASVDPADREGIQSVRRIAVRTDGMLNHVPTIASATVGGAPPPGAVMVPRCATGATCDPVTLALVAGAGSVETRDDGMPETLLVSFFVTGGSVDRPRAVATDASPLGADGSLSAKWTPPATPGPAHVWFVLRDGRGGDVVREIDVTVE